MLRKIIYTLLLLVTTNSLLAKTVITIRSIKNFTTVESKRVERIIFNLQEVINSDTFRYLVYSHNINGQRVFRDNNGESNETIYVKIMAGAEILDHNVDMEWQLDLVKRYIFSRNTLAYTYLTTPEIYFSSRYIKNGDDSSIAGTICHEYMHKLGYFHSKVHTNDRIMTVPYGVGAICELIYTNIFNPMPFIQEEVVESCDYLCEFKRFLEWVY